MHDFNRKKMNTVLNNNYILDTLFYSLSVISISNYNMIVNTATTLQWNLRGKEMSSQATINKTTVYADYLIQTIHLGKKLKVSMSEMHISIPSLKTVGTQTQLFCSWRKPFHLPEKVKISKLDQRKLEKRVKWLYSHNMDISDNYNWIILLHCNCLMCK